MHLQKLNFKARALWFASFFVNQRKLRSLANLPNDPAIYSFSPTQIWCDIDSLSSLRGAGRGG